MSIDYSLKIITSLERQQIHQLLVEALEFEFGCWPARFEDGQYWEEHTFVWGKGLRVSASYSSEEIQASTERDYGFRPNVYVYMEPARSSAEDEYFYAGYLNLVRTVIVLLQQLPGDAIFFSEGGNCILLRLEGELVVSQEYWLSSWLNLRQKFELLQVKLPYRVLPLNELIYGLEIATDKTAVELMQLLATTLALEWQGETLTAPGLVLWATASDQLSLEVYLHKRGKFVCRPEFYPRSLLAPHLGFQPTVHVGFEIFTVEPENFELVNRKQGYAAGWRGMLQATMALLQHLPGDAVLHSQSDSWTGAGVVWQRQQQRLVVDPSYLEDQPALAEFCATELTLPYEVEDIPNLPRYS